VIIHKHSNRCYLLPTIHTHIHPFILIAYIAAHEDYYQDHSKHLRSYNLQHIDLEMCNGSTRVSQGGSIAVLRPRQQLQRSQSEEEMLLFFSNRCASRGTSVEFEGEGWNAEKQKDRHWIVIQ
jgi:hypothetical protein